MPRVVKPDVFRPSLKFRYKCRMIGQAPGLEFYGRSVNLPKWDNVNGWNNPIKMRCYHFENITVRELSEISPKDVKLVIEILAPDGFTTLYEWRLVGDVTGIDYGDLDYAIDEVTEATITFEPRECLIAFEPNKLDNE